MARHDPGHPRHPTVETMRWEGLAPPAPQIPAAAAAAAVAVAVPEDPTADLDVPGIVSDSNDEGDAPEAWPGVDSGGPVDPGDENGRHRAQPVNPATAACINCILTKLPCITRAIATLSPAAAARPRLAIGRGRGRVGGPRPAPAARGGRPTAARRGSAARARRKYRSRWRPFYGSLPPPPVVAMP